jgi:hypothetical protein
MRFGGRHAGDVTPGPWWRSREYCVPLLGRQPAVEGAATDAHMAADVLHRDASLGDEPTYEALAYPEVSGGLRHREQRVDVYVYAASGLSSRRT